MGSGGGTRGAIGLGVLVAMAGRIGIAGVGVGGGVVDFTGFPFAPMSVHPSVSMSAGPISGDSIDSLSTAAGLRSSSMSMSSSEPS